MLTHPVLDAVLAELGAGRAVALCAIVATRGSSPQPAGVMVCVDQAGRMVGTLGGGCVEADVRRQAHQVLTTRERKLITFALDNDFGYDDGMICGGAIDVAICAMSDPDEAESIRAARTSLAAGEPGTVRLRVDTADGLVAYRILIEPPCKLVIAGGGHIGKVLANLMLPLGFRVAVVDDRDEFANAQRFPPPIDPIAGDMATALSAWPIDANTYIVIVTRGHRHDEEVLGAVLGSAAKYIGMIGSRRKIKVIFEDLRHAGATEDQLGRVHAPIGLKIGSVTTDEIAVSIAAELVSVRRAEHRKVVEGPIPIPASES